MKKKTANQSPKSLLEKLEDLHKQATTENSHHYTASVLKEAMEVIRSLAFPDERLEDGYPLIVYFKTQKDLDEFVAMFQANQPTLRRV